MTAGSKRLVWSFGEVLAVVGAVGAFMVLGKGCNVGNHIQPYNGSLTMNCSARSTKAHVFGHLTFHRCR